MIIGTHNSGTSGRLVWWLRPVAWLLHPASRCQDRTIEQQLEDGVRLFNLQVCRYKGAWRISHGVCIYEAKLMDILDRLKGYKGIVVQLYLDRNFWVKRSERAFVRLVGEVKRRYCSPDFILQKAWIEGTNKYPHKTSCKLSIEEHYWSATWAKGRGWLDKLPLPRRHARRYNAVYKKCCKADFLMLDFYEL